MAIWDAFKGAGSGEKKQESDTFQNLSNLFGSTYSSGVGLQERGKEDTGQGASFFKKVAAGDRTAIAPAVNAAVQGSDAAKRERAQMGTARGGGVAGEAQTVEDHTRALISSLLGEAQTGAAHELGAIGSGETSAGNTSLGVASGTETNLSSLLHQDVKEKNESAAKMWGALIKGGINLASGGFAGGLKGAVTNL